MRLNRSGFVLLTLLLGCADDSGTDDSTSSGSTSSPTTSVSNSGSSTSATSSSSSSSSSTTQDPGTTGDPPGSTGSDGSTGAAGSSTGSDGSGSSGSTGNALCISEDEAIDIAVLSHYPAIGDPGPEHIVPPVVAAKPDGYRVQVCDLNIECPCRPEEGWNVDVDCGGTIIADVLLGQCPFG